MLINDVVVVAFVLKAIVLLFKDDSTDNENFPYPNISKVKISIEGMSNKVYSRDFTRNRFYEEASRLFSNKTSFDQNVTVTHFFSDSFCVNIDLSSNELQTFMLRVGSW